MLTVNGPFVLLDDARDSAAAPARLYTDPVEIITAHSADELDRALQRLTMAQRDGLHAAGYLGYEAGYALEPRLAHLGPTEVPLLWFGLFEGFRSIQASDVPALLPHPRSSWLGSPRPDHIVW